MQIDTGNSDPVSQKPYPIAMKHYDWGKDEINKHLYIKVVCSRHFSWSVSIIVIPKGDGGKYLVFDYGAINKVTQKFVWPKLKIYSPG